MIPESLDILLPRAQAARALMALGYPVSPATLATKATRGGGPPYRRFGRKPLYRWGDVLAWAEARMTEPRRERATAEAVASAAAIA